jgi:hypothetical protein
VLDSLGLCSGYTPLTMPGAASQSYLQFVGAWDALNPDRRDALYARLSWCIGAGAASPCDPTKLIQVMDAGAGGQGSVFWAWAGWFDSTNFASSYATALSAPAVLTYNCSGASSV